MKDEVSAQQGRGGRLIKWSLIAVGWALFGLFFASQVIIIRAYEGRPLRLGETLAAWMICACAWLAVTPLMLSLARRFPLERRGWLKNALVHLAAGSALA